MRTKALILAWFKNSKLRKLKISFQPKLGSYAINKSFMTYLELLLIENDFLVKFLQSFCPYLGSLWLFLLFSHFPFLFSLWFSKITSRLLPWAKRGPKIHSRLCHKCLHGFCEVSCTIFWQTVHMKCKQCIWNVNSAYEM